MERKKINITPMSADSFSAYGTWISKSIKEPDSSSEEFCFWNKLGVLGHEGGTSVSIVQTYGKNGLIEEHLEQHKNTCEALLPTEDIIIVIALSDEQKPAEPDLDTVRAFQVKKGEAVVLHPGVWHHAPLTESEVADTFVVFYENTPEEDLLFYNTTAEFGISFEVVR